MNRDAIRNKLEQYYQDSPGKKTATDRVYIALMLRADADGIAWPSISMLAEDTNVRTRHIKEALVKLICRGAIVQVTAPNPENERARSNYRMENSV